MNGGRVCVGAFDTGIRTNLRLLTSTAANQPEDTPYQVGQLWNLTYIRRSRPVPPHVEDVLVSNATLTGNQRGLAQFIRTNCTVLTGSISGVFDHCIQLQSGGAAYISRTGGIPSGSVCFWEADAPLERNDYRGKVKYSYTQRTTACTLAYVGLEAPLPRIAARTLLRLSLARWWRPQDANPDEEQKCYVQLSGWYI
jgi:hypothetical protein